MNFGFDLTKVEVETDNRGALPAGNYTAVIEKVEKRSSKKNDKNKYINVQYKVCDMEKRNGAVFFDIVNIHNETDAAQELGRKRLKTMFIAAGASDSEMNTLTPEWFVGKKVECVIGVEKSEEYGDKNRVYQILKANTKGGETFKEAEAPSWM